MNLFKSLPFLDDTDPNVFGALIMTYSNLDEDLGTTEWDGTTAFVAGDIVYVEATHRLYEAIVGNTNKFPPDNLGAEWIDIGATNRWRAFDLGVQSQTVADVAGDGIIYKFLVNSLATAMALFNLSAGRVRVVVSEPGDELTILVDGDGDALIDDDGNVICIGAFYDQTFDLLDSGVLTDWFSYFFAETETKSQLLIRGIPAFSGSTMIVEIKGGAEPAVGEIAVGKEQLIGKLTTRGEIRALDFSRVDEDPFGNISILRRGSAKRIEYPVAWPAADNTRIDNILDDIRSQPAVFYSDDGDDGLGFFTYGFYQTYDISVISRSISFATIEVRSLI
jgi:hypothetical protein